LSSAVLLFAAGCAKALEDERRLRAASRCGDPRGTPLVDRATAPVARSS
jgi:hypothetical protein